MQGLLDVTGAWMALGEGGKGSDEGSPRQVKLAPQPALSCLFLLAPPSAHPITVTEWTPAIAWPGPPVHR